MAFFRLPDNWKTSKSIRFLFYAIFGVAFYLLLLQHILPETVDLKPDTVSNKTIVSPVTKVDEQATQKAKDQAADSVEPQYTQNEQITNRQIEQIDRIFVDIRKTLTHETLTSAQKMAELKKTISDTLPDEFYQQLVQISPEQITQLRLQTREIVKYILGLGVREEDLEDKKNQVDRTLITSALDSDARAIVRELARYSIVPNEILDEQKTLSLKNAAADAVEPVMIRKGQVIVSAGEVVTEDQYLRLSELGLIQSKTLILPYIGLALFILLMLVAIDYYLLRFQKKIHHNNQNLLIIFFSLLLTILAMKLITLGMNLEWSTVGYLAPVAFGAMLITLLLNGHMALISVVFLSVVASIMFHGDDQLLFDFRYGIVALVNGMTTVFALMGMQSRSTIFRAGLLASLMSMVAILSIQLLITNQDWNSFVQSMIFGFASGVISAILAMGCLPYLESLFGILSPLRLIELGNPNQELLQELLIKTPGTYHHSVIVANLAESAAEAIGANGLLARVGSYYHDIGKTKRPRYYIENQIGEDNPHDDLPPNLSKTIIISHARDGARILKEKRLPEPIRDIAAQHHGTTLLKYFYHKAKQQNEKVLEEDYRYPGPKAQFKEVAIVGIADSVEAAIRSLAKPSPTRIENMVRKIIQDRLEDGQFDECDLTFKELDLIAKAMCATLQGIFHSRIEYPDESATKGQKHD